MLIMISAFFSDSFKYFHTADVFAALVPAFDRITSLFGTIYSVFSLIQPNTDFGCRTFGASLTFKVGLSKKILISNIC